MEVSAVAKSGRVMWLESAVGTTNEVFPWNKAFWPRSRVHLMRNGHPCYSPRTAERKDRLFGDTL